MVRNNFIVPHNTLHVELLLIGQFIAASRLPDLYRGIQVGTSRRQGKHTNMVWESPVLGG